jgi:hypothetical protein
MDAFELNKFIHAQINPVQEIKAPEILKIKHVKVTPDLKPDILSTQTNQIQSCFPWVKVAILGGVVVLTFIIIYEIWGNQNYKNVTKRKDDQHSTYQ